MTLRSVIDVYEEMARAVRETSGGVDDGRSDAMVVLDLTSEAARTEFAATVSIAAAAVALRLTGFEGLRE